MNYGLSYFRIVVQPETEILCQSFIWIHFIVELSYTYINIDGHYAYVVVLSSFELLKY